MLDSNTILKLLQQNPIYKSALEIVTSEQEKQQIEKLTINIVETTMNTVLNNTTTETKE